ncbi:hypothetical protein PYW07_006375 [Mythimna separata]|uniref:Gag protein n=1 Tax=Mythimna separata TaxID=271217 RepID=A0AAD7YVX5_MYTSE|nr:hypothetical protein PYW07_006375 [Mythimna separata]
MAMASIDLATFRFVSELLPKYDGNPKTLNYFIREVENVMLLLDPQVRVNPAIVSLIKSKLSDSAISAIASEDTVDSWQTIKAALTRRLGEPRNEIQLMQELTRLRRNKNEDAETFGKRLREILDTLNVVGRHTDKSYYESMVIDQYVNNLDFHVSIGVRIAQPTTLEAAIVTARQEEARLAFNRLNNSFNALTIQNKPKEIPKPNQTVPQNNNFAPRNSWNIDQRQQRGQGIPPRPASGNVRPSGSGTFRNPGNFRPQPNIPRQQVNPPQKVSDVTMRSVSKPETPRFASEEMFYTQHNQDQCYPDYNAYYEGEFNNNLQPNGEDYSYTQTETPVEGPNHQDFPQNEDPLNHG